MTDEDMFMQKRLLDLSEQSYRNNHYTFTGFLTLAEQDLFYQLLAQRPGMEYTISGGSEGCERCLIRFGSEESLGYEEPFPIVCVEIAPALKKYAESLKFELGVAQSYYQNGQRSSSVSFSTDFKL